MDQKVLIIDDDRFIRKVLRKSLADHFQVEEAEGGQQGLEIVEDMKPDVILLDVEMPGMNGYEVCELIRQKKSTQKIPVLFLSSHSSLRERMLGYEAGADDYMKKPCDQNELLAKIFVLTKAHQERNELAQAIDSARQAAMEAMTGSSELGMAMMFAEQAYTCKTPEQLAVKVFAFASQIGVRSFLMLEAMGNEYFYNCNGGISPIVQDMMRMLRKQDRIIDFGTRTQVNFPNVSMLIRNMPINNLERYGRIKDILPPVLAAANARLLMIATEQGVVDQSEQVDRALQVIQNSLTQMNQRVIQQQQKSKLVLSNMLQELAVKLPLMGLDLDQEEAIMAEVEQAVNKVNELSEDHEELQDFGQKMSDSLGHINQKFQGLRNQISPPLEVLDEDDDGLGSVELF